MRALTVRQPWASLIIAGIKPVENRTWPVPKTLWTERPRPSWPNSDLVDYNSPFPFRLAIHAGKANDPTAPLTDWQCLQDVIGLPPPPRGALLGVVTVTGCHRACDCELDLSKWGYTCGNPLCSRWAEPEPAKGTIWHWELANSVALAEPIPYKGRQGLWNLPDDVLAEVPA